MTVAEAKRRKRARRAARAWMNHQRGPVPALVRKWHRRSWNTCPWLRPESYK